MDESGSDDILGLVIERVGSQVSLIRCAAVCRRWRRAIADAGFLRRFCSLHAPAIAGDYHNVTLLAPFMLGGEAGTSGPVFVPSSPSTVDARHCSLDFLPGGAGSWDIRDSRGSLLLMIRRGFGPAFPDMVVCEPLTRRCVVIPPPPDFDDDTYFSESFLVDGYSNKAGGRISVSNFRVRFLLCSDGHTHTAMFTAAGDTGLLWSEKIIDHSAPNLELSCLLGHAGGSWYFYVQGRTLIVLDGSTGDFSSSVLPPLEDWDLHAWSNNFFVTNGRDGMPRIITVIDDTMKVLAKLDGCKWVLEKSFLLSVAAQGLPGYQPWFFNFPQNVLTRGEGFVVLSPQYGGPWRFSIDLETMEVAPAADMGLMMFRCELPWPPALHACLD
ncbi:unnamed protein product [Urochloa decumbens]|uniref:F-box domain-containing protein n=1 Tax=Urochloa decumbens TaxID=240449 RepID=A0ABC9A2I0_9POAL